MAYVKKPYTRKVWVNVSNPSSLPDIPEGQDALACFDEDNMNRIEDGIEEALSSVSAHTHSKSDVGLGNVDNTSDINKPVSTAQATAIADARKAGTDAQSNLNSHLNDTTKHITAAERNTWNNKANASHSHDDRYYTESEVDNKLNSKASSSHTHTASDVGLGDVSCGTDTNNDYVRIGKNATVNTDLFIKKYYNGVAIGYGSMVNTYGVAIGTNAKSSGNSCISIGKGATTDTNVFSSAMAIGCNATANNNAMAIGCNATANNEDVVAIGYEAVCDKAGSIQLGQGETKADDIFQVRSRPLLNLTRTHSDLDGGAGDGMIFADRLPIFKGSYTGADAYGESNKVTINLPFVPKAIYIVKEDFSAYTPMPAINGVGTMKVRRGTSDYECTCEWSGTRLCFWNTSSAKNQLNEAATYHYIAI